MKSKLQFRVDWLFLAALGCLLAAVSTVGRSQAADWRPVPDAMLTSWGEGLTVDDVWTEYPRPQMKRNHWTNLNGLWDYAVTARQGEPPAEWQGIILVPFALESPLSGVGRRLGPEETLWYHRSFDLEKVPAGKLLLHFEAVDYQTRVWVNGQHVGDHTGGNLPFAFDIAGVARSGVNEIVLRVADATDAVGKYQLRGKQKTDNGGIWYTPVSGIWQTVWLESVPSGGIRRLQLTTIGADKIQLQVSTFDDQAPAGSIDVTVRLKGRLILQRQGKLPRMELAVPNPQRWSPDSPVLYDLQVNLLDAEGNTLDSVTSYVGLRELSKVRDGQGNWRLALNGKILFHWGTLDQGWWPDGLLTPPSDEAMAFDIQFLKAAGFNMIRKHIKVEPRRYYYHCDQLGMLVWQDQVSAGVGVRSGEWPKWQRLGKDHPGNRSNRAPDPGDPLDATWPDHAHRQFMSELQGMIDLLANHPSVTTWTPFNERWGQHRTLLVGRWIKEFDPTRYLNIASGGNFFPVGDLADEHNYPLPTFPIDDPRYADYVKIVGEFGGHGWLEPDHQWSKKKRNWGYGGLPKTREEYIERYVESATQLGLLKRRGVAGAVYTQTTDVEGELNGLITYDRKVLKIPARQLREIARKAGILDD